MSAARPTRAKTCASRSDRRLTASARRAAFTLIELIAALIASTILLAAMAATVAIATNLLGLPLEDEATVRTREIVDHLASDLRHATATSTPSETEFQVVRPDPADGSPATILYEADGQGLTRRRSSDPLMRLARQTPQYQSSSDARVPPPSPPSVPRCRAVQTASSNWTTNALAIDVPPGTRPGDLLLLCVAGTGAHSFTAAPGPWQTVAADRRGSTRLSVMRRFHAPGDAPAVMIEAQPWSSIAVVLLAIENTDPASPVHWAATDNGYAYPPFSWTYPSPLEPSDAPEQPLNLQIVGAAGDPWHDTTLGLASFVDAGRATAARNNYYYRTSVGVALRSGVAPSTDTPATFWHRAQGDWLQAAVCLEPAS